LLVNGPDQRGMDVGLLYRSDQVQMVSFQARQGCTSLIDGLGPDGNLDVANPQNDLTCDTDGNGSLDGNRLFSRLPLLVEVQVCPPGCAGNPINLWLMINHLKSKTEDTAAVQYTLARRVEQAQFVADLAQEVEAAHPNIPLVVLGDMNDTPGSQPLSVLEAQGLHDLAMRIDKASQYTYIYQGISQLLDHILTPFQPGLVPLAVTPLHINADYPYAFTAVSDSMQRSSDHDALLAQFGIFGNICYLPLVSRP
jgi:hypothetical protein